MQRAVAMAGGQVIEDHDLDLPIGDRQERQTPTMELVSKVGILNGGSFQEMKMKMIEEFERTYLCDLLSAHQGNISKAARAAKKERRAFQRLLHKHGLDRRVFCAA